MRKGIEQRPLDFCSVSGIKRTTKGLNLRQQVFNLRSGSLLGHNVEFFGE